MKELHTSVRATSSVGHISTDIHAEHLPVVLMVIHRVSSSMCQTAQVKQMTWGRKFKVLFQGLVLRFV